MIPKFAILTTVLSEQMERNVRRIINHGFGLCLCFLFWAFPLVSGAVTVSGTITGDTVWTNSEVIEVVDFVTVDTTGHLTIEPGTIIRFRLLSKMDIYGQLTSVGDSASRIVFTTVADTTNGSPSSSNIWYGLRFWDNSQPVMSYCDIRYALDGIAITKANLEINSCTIENFMGYGFFIDGIDADPRIDVTINSCLIRQSNPTMKKTGTGIYTFRSVNLSVAHTEISDCRLGINIYSNNYWSPLFSITRSEISRHYSDGIYIQGTG